HLLLRKYTSEQIIKAALVYQCIIGLLMLLGIWLQWFNVIALIFLMFIFLTGHGLNSPNTAALSLEPFSKNAGSAAALMGSFRLGMAGLVSALVSIFHTGSALPMISIMASCALGGILVLFIKNNHFDFFQKKHQKKKAEMVY